MIPWLLLHRDMEQSPEYRYRAISHIWKRPNYFTGSTRFTEQHYYPIFYLYSILSRGWAFWLDFVLFPISKRPNISTKNAKKAKNVKTVKFSKKEFNKSSTSVRFFFDIFFTFFDARKKAQHSHKSQEKV